jgi:ADP-heptose:LPS heptosyltransferase
MRALLLLTSGLYIIPDILFRSIAWFRQIRNKTETLAIVRLDNIGDMIVFADICLQIVNTQATDKKVLIICKPVLVPLMKSWLPEAIVFGLDPKKLWQPHYRYRQLWRLHRFNIKTFFHPVVSHYQYLHTTGTLLRALPSKNTIGYQTEAKGWRKLINKLSDWHYTLRLNPPVPEISENKKPEIVLATHERTYHMLAATHFGATHHTKELPTPNTQQTWAFPSDAYSLVVPGASNMIKRWPLGHFVQLILNLHDMDPHHTFVIVGDADEAALGEKLRHHTGPYCINLAGKTSLIDTWQLVSGSTYIISNDTSIAHMGEMLSKPTFVPTGGGQWGRFLPWPDGDSLVAVHKPKPCYNCNWNCIYPLKKDQAAPCITDISVAMVQTAIAQAFAK